MSKDFKIGGFVIVALIAGVPLISNVFDINRQLVNPIIAAGIGVFMFFAGFFELNRKRLIQNIPTSKISSMAMGLVEIQGQIYPYTEAPLIAPYSKTECVFYKYTIQQFVRDSQGYSGWKTISEGSSRIPFYIDDGTGKVLVNVQDADIRLETRYISSRADIRQPMPAILTSGTMKYTEAFVMPNESLYVLGTAKNMKSSLNPQKEVAKKVTDWYYDEEKQKEFDMNKDGEIDKQEYEMMKTKAGQEILKPASDEKNENQKDHAGLLDVIITKGEHEKTLIVSNNSEKEIISQIGKRVVFYIFGGVLLTLGAIIYAFMVVGKIDI